MKKILFTAVLIVTAAYSASAQDSTSNQNQEERHYYAQRYTVRYRDISSYYNPREYRETLDDPYNPIVSGLASFLIPGLGQCINDEWGRGLGIFAANIGFGLLELTEMSLLFYSAAADSQYYMDYGRTHPRAGALLGTSLCASILTASAHLAFNVWNICDAVNIAKVKNMYYQDLRFAPQLSFTPSIGNSLQPTAGLSLTLKF